MGGGQPQNNQAGGGGGGSRRRNRRRGGGGGQPAFVGPMDHSYRQAQGEGNGNSFGGRPQGRYGNQPNRPQQFFQGPSVDPLPAMREDAPTRIYAFIEDLFFVTKIQDTARKLNVKVEFAKNGDELLEKLEQQAEPPSLVVFDLNNVNAKPLQAIPKFRAKYKRGTSIVGFVSHVQGDLKLKAQEAGCDVVMPRSAFSANLPQILRRHGAPDDHDEPQSQFGLSSPQ